MSMSYKQKQERIKALFDFEIEYNVPENNRWTCGTSESPFKKPYVDMRQLCGYLKLLGL